MNGIFETRQRLKPWQYLLQAVYFALFMVLVWFFSKSPAVRLIEPDQGVIRIAFSHAGELREPCRRLTQAELNELPANMRKLEDCPRERSPVVIEVRLDDEPLYQASLPPQGLFGDGGVDVYFSRKLPTGSHRLSLRMDDSVRDDGFEHDFDEPVEVGPAEILLIGFDVNRGFSITSGDDF